MFKVGDEVFYNFPAHPIPSVGRGFVLYKSGEFIRVVVSQRKSGVLEKEDTFPFRPEELTLVQRKPVNLGDFL